MRAEDKKEFVFDVGAFLFVVFGVVVIVTVLLVEVEPVVIGVLTVSGLLLFLSPWLIGLPILMWKDYLKKRNLKDEEDSGEEKSNIP